MFSLSCNYQSLKEKAMNTYQTSFFHEKHFNVKEVYQYSTLVKKNKAVYMATEVACGWAGAVTQKPPVNAEKS